MPAARRSPAERTRWTLRPLESKVVELNIADHASGNTIGRVLKKNRLKPHLEQQWVIPPQQSSAFAAAMEDVLAVCLRPRDPDVPLLCFEEASKQLIAGTRQPVPMKPGHRARADCEYERHGTARGLLSGAPTPERAGLRTPETTPIEFHPLPRRPPGKEIILSIC